MDELWTVSVDIAICNEEGAIVDYLGDPLFEMEFDNREDAMRFYHHATIGNMKTAATYLGKLVEADKGLYVVYTVECDGVCEPWEACPLV